MLRQGSHNNSNGFSVCTQGYKITMFRQTIVYLARYVLFLFCLASTPVIAQSWQTLSPGLEYLHINMPQLTPWSHVHVFRIDLKKNELSLIMANFLSQQHAPIRQFSHYDPKTLLAINGGFFDRNFHPLGLRVSNQQQYNPLKGISWWGIFYVQNQIPHVSNLRQYKHQKHVDFAVQSGPRLLINGHIPTLKPGHDERSALGIDSTGHVIILITQNAPMTTTALAEFMRAPPINAFQALNLDGGSSSQMRAHVQSFQLNVHGFSNVSDAIIVKPRQ